MENKILRLLDKASDKDLMMSRKNCHIYGLHSIVLKNNNGRLTRCFIAGLNHEMHRNIRIDDMSLSLGVHSHRYDIEIEGVSGVASNIRFSEGDHGTSCNLHRFYDKNKVEFIREANLSVVGIDEIAMGKSILMRHYQLHTVYVPEFETASWIVYEGEELTNNTLLYSGSPIHCEEYDSFSCASDVRQLVYDFFNTPHSPQTA